MPKSFLTKKINSIRVGAGFNKANQEGLKLFDESEKSRKSILIGDTPAVPTENFS